MSGPVDVLAVMQRTESCARLYYQRPDAYGRETPADEQMRFDEEAQQARAAVAELVEAVSAVYGEPCFSEGQAADDPCSPDCMSCRIRAALAKFGGAA